MSLDFNKLYKYIETKINNPTSSTKEHKNKSKTIPKIYSPNTEYNIKNPIINSLLFIDHIVTYYEI